MTTVLAVDTSSERGSAALWTGDGALLVETWDGAATHSQHLLNRLRDLLDRAGLTLRDVSLFAGCIGPGSYTGLRVGLAAITGLSMVSKTRAVGISCLQAMAWAVTPRPGAILSVRNGYRQDLFVQPFDGDGRALAEPELRRLDDLAAMDTVAVTCVVGDGGPTARGFLENLFPRIVFEPDPGPLAAAMASRVTRSAGAPLVPLYVRPVDIGIPRPR